MTKKLKRNNNQKQHDVNKTKKQTNNQATELSTPLSVEEQIEWFADLLSSHILKTLYEKITD